MNINTVMGKIAAGESFTDGDTRFILKPCEWHGGTNVTIVDVSGHWHSNLGDFPQSKDFLRQYIEERIIPWI